jgi:plasmid stabilization system protein ParE
VDRSRSIRVRRYNRISRNQFWTEKELRNLAKEIEKTIDLLSRNPLLFQSSDLNLAVRRVVVAKKNTLYYRINGNTIEVLSFFSNRQNPQKRKI